ncbi:MAG: hypothetical protein US70_C0004G0013 [Parcubacteria group bacterium GW2011_GWD2_38_11]|nr:MAG: hypothetical protein US70_C0004G0013 [Parcubacteria group bacterium GW2011_GWD2_38_11]
MIIFLYGVDNFRSLEKLSDLKNKYLEKNGSGTDLSVLDYGEGASIENLSTALSAQGLFSTKRLVILKNSMLKGSTEVQKGILAILKANPDTEKDADTIVIFYENGSPKKNGALYKFLFKIAKRQEFAPLEGALLTNWALAFAKTLSAEISFTKNALNMLLAATGSDLNVLSNEITKLVNFRNSGEITDSDVVLLVKSKVDSTMFETIESLVSGNKSKTLDLFHQQLTKGEDVFYILSMYTYQIRTLLKIGDFYWQGMTSAPQIAQASGIHPYVVQKSLSQIRNLSEQKTKQMLRDLAEIDFNAKTGKVDPILALDTFIVSL